MRLSDSLDNLSKLYAAIFENVGVLAFLLMMLVTTIDVVGAKLFLTPLKGSLDLVMLLQAVAVTFATGATLRIGQHVAVEFFVLLFPRKVRSALYLFCDVLGLALFIVIVWQLLVYGRSLQDMREVSPTIRVPLYPFAYAAAAGASTMCPAYVCRIVNRLLGKDGTP